MQTKNRFKVLLLGLILSSAIFIGLAGSASATGSAQYTVESSAASVETGKEVTLRFYVTPSGGPGYFSGEVHVNLTNLAVVANSGVPGAFTGTGAAPGASGGSTSFDVTASHSGTNVSTSKTLMYTLTVSATGAGGTTGTIALSGAKANDLTVTELSDDYQMTTSTQNRTVSITAPPATGGGSGSSGGTGGTTTTPKTTTGSTGATNMVDNPTNNQVGVGTDENGVPVAVTENELSLIASGIETDDKASDEVATVTQTSVFKRSVTIAIIAAVIIGALVAGKLLYGKFATAKAVGGHGLHVPFLDGSDPGSTSKDTDKHDDLPKPPSTPGGPTIIHPGQ